MTTSNAIPASEEEISARAYEIWEAEGRPEGRDKEHWFRASELVAEAAGKDGPGQVRPAGRDFGRAAAVQHPARHATA